VIEETSSAEESPAKEPVVETRPGGTPVEEVKGEHAEGAELPPDHPDHPAHKAHLLTQHFHAQRGPMFTVKNVLWLIFFLALTVATRCANWRNIFVRDQTGQVREIYYEDGDCYSRMTRVREILEGWGVIHYHAWENYPQGTWPHTTAPMDYLIVLIALMLKPFRADYIDMAGAIVSPLLGVLITAFLALWARELNQQYRRLMLLLVSLSPIIAHGTALGRPDHQSLQMLLVAVGVGAELIMARAPCVSWGIVSGAAWGLALWVSLYEPLVLMLTVFLTKLIFYRPKLFVKERVPGLLVLFAVLGLAYWLEGAYLVKSFKIEAADQSLREYFGNWSNTIAEMKGTKELEEAAGVQVGGMGAFSDLLFRWVGLGLLVAPLLMIARLRDTKRSTLLLALMVVTFIFTLMQSRWGYFFGLIYAMSLPWQLSLFKWKWAVWTLFILSLWPMAREWEGVIYPDMNTEFLSEGRLNDQRRLRQAANYIQDHAPGAILAPWWWTPQLVYWSGQPGVAGSSHESLSGIVATARFFSATDGMAAKAITDERCVETVVVGEPGPIDANSQDILGQPPTPNVDTMADVLWERPHSAPRFLHVIFDNNVVKVFQMNHGWIPR